MILPEELYGVQVQHTIVCWTSVKHWLGSLELLLIHLKLLVALAPLLLVHLAIHISMALSYVTKEGEGQAGSREGVRGGGKRGCSVSVAE